MRAAARLVVHTGARSLEADRLEQPDSKGPDRAGRSALAAAGLTASCPCLPYSVAGGINAINNGKEIPGTASKRAGGRPASGKGASVNRAPAASTPSFSSAFLVADTGLTRSSSLRTRG